MTYYLYREHRDYDWSYDAYPLCFNYTDNPNSAVSTNITRVDKHLPWGYDRYIGSATVNMLVENHNAKKREDYTKPQSLQDYDFVQKIHDFMSGEYINDFFDYIWSLNLCGKGLSARLDITRFVDSPLLLYLIRDVSIPYEYLYIDYKSGKKYITAENCGKFWDSILGPNQPIHNIEEELLIIGG